MNEYKDEYDNKREHGEKDDDKSTDNFKDINDKSKQNNDFIESSESETLRDDLFEPKGDLKPDADDFVPDEKYKSIDMDFIPDKEYKPDMDSFEPKSDISRDIEDFKPDKNYDSNNDRPELNSEHELNAKQEKDDKTLEPYREHEQDNNSLDEKSKLTGSRVDLDNDGESDIPVQSNKNQSQAEIGEEKEQVLDKDKDNPFEKSNEELNEGDKEEFVENVAINHGIDFEYLLQHDLKDLIEDIKSAEKERLIYANDSLITVKEFNSNEKLMTEVKKEMYRNRDELNENSEGTKSENKNPVLIENLNDFCLCTVEGISQEGSENRDRTQLKEFTRDSKKEFSREKQEDSKDKGVNSGSESELSVARDSRQYTVQVLKSESQSLNKPEKCQDSSEKAFQKEVNQKYEQEKKEKKEDGALIQATTEIGKASSQDIKSRDKASKTDKIKKQAIKKEVPLIKHRYTTPETSVSNDLNDLREIYRQERGKRPIYRGKETKGFLEWKREKSRLTKPKANDSTNSLDTSDFKTQTNLEIQRIQSEKCLKKKESKEEWESTLRNWVNDVNEKDVYSENKKELNEIIENYSELRENYKELKELIRKYKNQTIAQNEIKQLTRLIEKFEKVKPNRKDIFVNLCAFRNFHLANEIWYKERILAEKEKFTKFLAQKLLLQNEKIEIKNIIKNNNDKKLVSSSNTNFSDQIGNKCCNINLKKYAKTVIDNYRKSILEEYKKLGIKPKQVRLNGAFSIKRMDFKDSEQFDKIVNSRDKYLWYGLVYKITELFPDKTEGRSIGGFTTRSLSNRWKNYVFKAVFQQGQGGKLHKLIYNYLYNFGFENLKINGNYNWRLIFGLLDSRFRRTPIEIHFSSNSLRGGEINFIANNNLIESGLNTRTGGDGGRDKIDLPMIQIAYYISLGYMETNIHQMLIDRGYICSLNTVRRRIRDFWGSYEEAQIKFLRYVFYMLMCDSFHLYEINDAFDKFTLNYIETMFGSITYKDLIKIIKTKNQKEIFDLPVTKKLDGWEGKTKLRIPANVLIDLIIKYSTMNKAITDKAIQMHLKEYEMSYYRFALINQIYNQLGCPTWDDARKIYALPYILEDFRKNQPFEIIYQRYGWSKLYAHNHNRISSKLFFGMRSIQVRQYLIENPSIKSYDQFEEVFFSIKGKFSKPLPPKILNNLIIKHIDIDKAQLELNSMGYSMYNFLRETEKVYSSWDNAFKLVKIPYIINSFRYGINPIEIYQMVGYSKISAIHHNEISKRLFFGANTEMFLLFLEMNPIISTLRDFEIKYNQGFSGKVD